MKYTFFLVRSAKKLIIFWYATEFLQLVYVCLETQKVKNCCPSEPIDFRGDILQQLPSLEG